MDKVRYECSCKRFVTVDKLYFCDICNKFKCRECAIYKADCMMCPSCYETVPVAKTGEKPITKCKKCFMCPKCNSNNQLRISALVGIQESNVIALEKGPRVDLRDFDDPSKSDGTFERHAFSLKCAKCGYDTFKCDIVCRALTNATQTFSISMSPQASVIMNSLVNLCYSTYIHSIVSLTKSAVLTASCFISQVLARQTMNKISSREERMEFNEALQEQEERGGEAYERWSVHKKRLIAMPEPDEGIRIILPRGLRTEDQNDINDTSDNSFDDSEEEEEEEEEEETTNSLSDSNEIENNEKIKPDHSGNLTSDRKEEFKEPNETNNISEIHNEEKTTTSSNRRQSFENIDDTNDETDSDLSLSDDLEMSNDMNDNVKSKRNKNQEKNKNDSEKSNKSSTENEVPTSVRGNSGEYIVANDMEGGDAIKKEDLAKELTDKNENNENSQNKHHKLSKTSANKNNFNPKNINTNRDLLVSKTDQKLIPVPCSLKLEAVIRCDCDNLLANPKTTENPRLTALNTIPFFEVVGFSNGSDVTKTRTKKSQYVVIMVTNPSDAPVRVSITTEGTTKPSSSVVYLPHKDKPELMWWNIVDESEYQERRKMINKEPLVERNQMIQLDVPRVLASKSLNKPKAYVQRPADKNEPCVFRYYNMAGVNVGPFSQDTRELQLHILYEYQSRVKAGLLVRLNYRVVVDLT